jgi:hypothetical protein
VSKRGGSFNKAGLMGKLDRGTAIVGTIMVVLILFGVLNLVGVLKF